jgi:site-specific recombinase XerD
MTPVRQRMIEDTQVRNLSPHTQASYVQQVSLFARYFSKSPEVLGPEEIRAYQVYLTNEKKLAASSILIAVSALRFLYKVTLLYFSAGCMTRAIASTIRFERDSSATSIFLPLAVRR